MNEFVTWITLGTYAGAVMMVTLITQFLKQTVFGKMNAQLLSYIIAVLILIGIQEGQPAQVLMKAIRVCMECVGIG